MTMTLEEIRKTIDTLDPKIRDLLLQRMDCSHKVAEVKQQDGSTTVFRADREQKILDTLGKEVPPERRAAYLAVVRKIMEASRMYQYGLLFDWNPGILAPLLQGFSMERGAKNVTVQFACSDCPNGLGKLLSMIGDYDVNLETLTSCPKMRQIAPSPFRSPFSVIPVRAGSSSFYSSSAKKVRRLKW